MFEHIYAGLTLILQGIGGGLFTILTLIFLVKFYLWLRVQCDPVDYDLFAEQPRNHGADNGKSTEIHHSSSDTGKAPSLT